MKVLTFLDADAHMHVFKFDTPEDRQNAFMDLLINYLKTDELFPILKACGSDNFGSHEIDLIEDAMERNGWPCFERSGGARMYICDITEGKNNSRIPLD